MKLNHIELKSLFPCIMRLQLKPAIDL